ncbi:polymorphic toxin-type HINT domain-containing protein [Myroides odoratimimus]|uniref:polymorphic toxin-type HINT domain-containing protein n=1 Tax=Myroides odoratimimus TaxID=76832 RepID=UPI003100B6EC
MEELEYITKGALMMCDEGGAPNYFSPTFNNKVKIHGCQVATNMDGLPAANIPSFKVCKITGGACNPVTMPMTWQDTWQVKVNHVHTLIGKSTCKCMIGGTIEFMTSGQVPLPEDAAAEVQNLQDQAQKELDDSGNGDSVGEAGFLEGMIPIWGSGRDMINAIQTGDTFGAVLNAGFLVWDVASIVAGALSFGAGTAIMQGAKVGMKAGIKAGTKVAGRVIKKKALEQLGKAGFKTLSKEALKKSIDDVAKKLLRTCVFACFPEGTPVHTEFGLKNIEDIEVGDLVWAYDEETETISLQPVVDVMVNESDHTVSVYTDKEMIETTAIHPFYVEDTGWVDASELEEGHKVLTKDNEPLTINKVEFNYEPKKVYNFTVGNFHTYFVGILAWLVHNAGRCLTQMMLESQKWFQAIMRGRNFNLAMNLLTKDIAADFGKLFSKEVFVKLANGGTKSGKGYVDAIIDGTIAIERKATDLTKIKPETVKAYIRDAAKYSKAKIVETGKTLDKTVYLQVENMKGVSDDILKYAADRNVKIIDDITSIFK